MRRRNACPAQQSRLNGDRRVCIVVDEQIEIPIRPTPENDADGTYRRGVVGSHLFAWAEPLPNNVGPDRTIPRNRHLYDRRAVHRRRDVGGEIA